MKKTLATFLILCLLPGCAPLIIGTGIYGGKLLAQEKTLGETINDKTVWTKIHTKILNQKLDKFFGNVNVKVNEGKVLLTGTVKNRELIVKILRICWDTQGVKEVINELKVSQEEFSVTNYAGDSWITTKARSKLLLSDVHSINFSLETIDGIIYLVGIAQSQTELDTVIKILSEIKGVKKVVHFVRVHKDIDDRINDTRTSDQYKTTDHSAFNNSELDDEKINQNINNDVDQNAFAKPHISTTDNIDKIDQDSEPSTKEVKLKAKTPAKNQESFDNNF